MVSFKQGSCLKKIAKAGKEIIAIKIQISVFFGLVLRISLQLCYRGIFSKAYKEC